MKTGDIYTLSIEKLMYEGMSLSHINNIPVFIDKGCPEDVVKVKITKINKNYVKAEILEIIKQSQYRVKPYCPMQNVCGSCNWQFISYEEQLVQKRNIVKEIIKNTAHIDIDVLETVASPKIYEYRHKVQYPVRQTKVSKRLLSGYYKKNTHELINIKYCPIQPYIINEINEFIKEQSNNLGISGFNETDNTGLIKHIVYRISKDRNQLLIIFVINIEKIPKELYNLASLIKEKYPIIVGVCANFNTKRTNVILCERTVPILGSDFYTETLSGIKYKISANSFFQVNPYSAIKIFDEIKNLIKDNINNPMILDAYSGVSSIGIWLSSIAKKIICVEESKSACLDALENIKINNIKNIEIINSDAGIAFNNLKKNNINFDVVIIDPPRKGSTKQALTDVTILTDKYLIYVSCNPATLARDMNILSELGFKPLIVKPVDMFCHTYHIETITLFKKVSS